MTEQDHDFTVADAPPDVPPFLSPGDLIARHVVERRLGGGGMGEVYLVRHPELDVLRALKVLRPEIADRHPRYAKLFLDEARLACRLQHPNAVNVLDVDADSGYCAMVMEYVDGGTAVDLIQRREMTEDRAVLIITGVARALAAAAELGMVHRDIKPDNIMLTRRGEPKLADFGAARLGWTDEVGAGPGAMLGTPGYFAPEQLSDAATVDARADIFSLGITFFEMLTGELPWRGTTTEELVAELLTPAPLPDVRTRNPDISPDCAAILARMVEKDRNRRISGANELLRAIDNMARAATTRLDLARKTPSLGQPIMLMRRRSSLITEVPPPPSLAARTGQTVALLSPQNSASEKRPACKLELTRRPEAAPQVDAAASGTAAGGAGLKVALAALAALGLLTVILWCLWQWLLPGGGEGAV